MTAWHPAPVKTMAESATSALNEADDKATETNAQRSEATRMRISRMTEQAQAASENGESSRNQRTIPDIDEINASLNARHTANKIPELTEAELESAMKRRGFRRGFAMVIILFAISIMPYVFASEIVEQFPETREYMVQYVDTVEQLRVQLREAAMKISALVEDLIPSDTAAATETTPVEPAADPVASTDG